MSTKKEAVAALRALKRCVGGDYIHHVATIQRAFGELRRLVAASNRNTERWIATAAKLKRENVPLLHKISELGSRNKDLTSEVDRLKCQISKLKQELTEAEEHATAPGVVFTEGDTKYSVDDIQKPEWRDDDQLPDYLLDRIGRRIKQRRQGWALTRCRDAFMIDDFIGYANDVTGYAAIGALTVFECCYVRKRSEWFSLWRNDSHALPMRWNSMVVGMFGQHIKPVSKVPLTVLSSLPRS